MINCKTCREAIICYRVITTTQKVEVQEHIANCPDCKKYSEKLKYYLTSL